MKKTLLAKSGSGEHYYKVIFEMKDNKLTVSCDCQAGILRQLCKHKKALILNDVSMLYDTEQEIVLVEIYEWTNKAGYQKIFKQYENIKNEIEKLKKEEFAARKQLERILNDGLD